MSADFGGLFAFLEKAGVRAVAQESGLAPALEPTPNRRECAWCNAVLSPGREPVSHGICEGCARTYFPAGCLTPESAPSATEDGACQR